MISISGISSGRTTQHTSPMYSQQRVHQDGKFVKSKCIEKLVTTAFKFPGDVNHNSHYVPPSEQQAPEPRKYTGAAIPSRSFKMLQAMTATTPENAGKSPIYPKLVCAHYYSLHSYSYYHYFTTDSIQTILILTHTQHLIVDKELIL